MTIEFELNGTKVEVEDGKTIIEAASSLGVYIPYFCYHKKLSVAANCRMCLVEVEKVAKPLPACATTVTSGMKVHTNSALVKKAQYGVMELLLINHPLDCPVCDQGGECQLQDLSMGYGTAKHRFIENKRAVSNKDFGPLITTHMTRCIHCTRCIRFSDEIGGYQELGMANRNNHSEVISYGEVTSELSGNMIDICPVGALTSTPFKYSARSWELSRRKTISGHDGFGSRLICQVDKYNKVARVLPYVEDAGECWISDRDRFSYEGLYTERAESPMLKKDGSWINVSWNDALEYVVNKINSIKNEFGASEIGVLGSPNSTVEELYLLQKFARNIGINNIDSRFLQRDFTLDKSQGALYFGDLKEFVNAKSLLLLGCAPRLESPLLALKIRQMVKHNSVKVNVINTINEDILCNIDNKISIDLRDYLFYFTKLFEILSGKAVDDNFEYYETLVEIANSIKNGCYIVLGEVIKMQPDYAKIVVLASKLSQITNGKFGVISTHSNELGAYLAGVLPHKGFALTSVDCGINVREMFVRQLKCYMLFNTEFELDSYDTANTLERLKGADTVISCSSYLNHNILEYADVVLPIATFFETHGSFINMFGKWQNFNSVTMPYKNSMPAWKLITMLASHFQCPDFSYNSITNIRNEITSAIEDKLSTLNNNTINIDLDTISVPHHKEGTLIRYGMTTMYYRDSISRRASSLQKTIWSRHPTLVISNALANSLHNISSVKVRQGDYEETFSDVVIDDSLPNDVVILLVNDKTVGFGGRFDEIYII